MMLLKRPETTRGLERPAQTWLFATDKGLFVMNMTVVQGHFASNYFFATTVIAHELTAQVRSSFISYLSSVSDDNLSD